MLLSYLNLEPSEDCLDKLKELLNTDPRVISFKKFFKWLKGCLPQGHVWRICPPSAPPPSSPPEVNCQGLDDHKKCKIKIKKCKKKLPKSMNKCKKNCKKDRGKKKPLCQKTCCELGFPV
jgi:hypothetical protein